MAAWTERVRQAWNVFRSNEKTEVRDDIGAYTSSYGGRPDRARLRVTNERSIISSIYTRISIDASGVMIKHVRLDDKNRYIKDMDSQLNECLKLDPNLDQPARAFRQDQVLSLIDKGTIAIVPIDTTLNPISTGGFDILSMRVGEITQWFPNHVEVNVYNEKTGQRQKITLPKRIVAIVENPLYSVMNEPNSTLQRLVRKLNILDAVDEQSGSGKLDLIIQLPYAIKTEARRDQAEKRRQDIEFQLKDSKYGIAYTDGTEKVTQLNRPAENNLLAQIEYLTKQLYDQLGLTEDIMNGTADAQAMLNYNNRTIEPILDAIVESMERTFLTKTARTQKQAIRYFRDPFKLVPVANIAEIADKFTRNEIMSSNEIRAIVGLSPADDPKADQLRNANMPAPSESAPSVQQPNQEGDSQNGTGF